MRERLLALSMIAASGLMAQTDTSVHNQPRDRSERGCCDTCCNTPCCCNNPRPCVDCECYVPAFYNLQCDWGFSFDAEFLYWYGNETNLGYASKARVTPVETTPAQAIGQFAFANQTIEHISAKWDPGFRVGIGFNSSCDGWDYNLIYTWYKNSSSSTTSVDDYGLRTGTQVLPYVGGEGESLLVNPWVNASASVITLGNFSTTSTILSFDKIAAKYTMRFNQIDLTLGRKYWLSKCFNLRTYAGLRGAWTNNRFATTSYRTFTEPTLTAVSANVAFTIEDSFKTKGWGVGVIAGVEPTWYFSNCFALYAQAGTGALWGTAEANKNENYAGDFQVATAGASFTGALVDSSSQRQSRMVGVLDLGLGLRWESTWCCDRYRTTLDLGWEHHVLFNQSYLFKTTDFFDVARPAGATPTSIVGGFRNFQEISTDLGIGGLVVRFKWDF